MSGKTLAYVWLSGWAIVFALSFIVTANTAAKDFGLTRGLNRVATFFGWQLAATVLALVVWNYARQFESGSWRWLFRIPVILAGTLLLIIVALCILAILFKPKPNSPTPMPPVTVVPKQDNTETFTGYYRQGFEQSEFYTLEGDGPYWVDA